jgi:hypothetical protein
LPTSPNIRGTELWRHAACNVTAVADPLDDLSTLWRWFADGILAGYCPLYDEIARSVADDRELLALQYSARPHAHLPMMLLAGAHYLLLDGVSHPLADVYAGRSEDPAPPLFRDLCLGRRDALLEVLNSRTVQTNEVGRSALIGPALTHAASGDDVQLVDVGCSAGLNMLCDQYRLDYGAYGATGPEDSPVRIVCGVNGGAPPVAPFVPTIAGRIGIDLDPPDLTDPDDQRWLLACVWPRTGRFERATRAIELGQRDPPRVLQGDALETLPGVLADREVGRIVVLNSWSFSYFSIEQRQDYIELLADVGRSRPVQWLCMDAPGVVEMVAGEVPPSGGVESDVVSLVTFEGDTAPRAEVLAFVQSHGMSLDWQASR